MVVGGDRSVGGGGRVGGRVVRRATGKLTQAGWALGLAWLVAACSPALNWRDVRPGDGALVAVMPCKPEAAQRDVSLAGHAVSLHMLSCDTADLVFAVAALRVPETLQAEEVVQAWKRASVASLKAPPDQGQAWVPVQRLDVPVWGWKVDGQRHDGSRVTAHLLWLARDREVFQIAVYGAASPEVLTALLEGMRWSPGI